MSIDDALRWAKPARRSALQRRPDADLPFVAERDVVAGGGILLDTCVYIDRLQMRTPPLIRALLGVRPIVHSTVAMMELAFPLGRLDPRHAGTRAASEGIVTLLNSMPVHRIVEPDHATSLRAAVLAGILSRVRNLPDTGRSSVNDCLLFIQAMRGGYTILTRNIVDFDFLSQMFPDGKVLLYRPDSGQPRGMRDP